MPASLDMRAGAGAAVTITQHKDRDYLDHKTVGIYITTE